MNEYPHIHVFRLILKICIILILVNIFCFFSSFLPVSNLSLYNIAYPGRPRLPFGEIPQESYNLTLNNMDAMLASHEIDSAPKQDAYRIVLIGDSSIWGFLQTPRQTLSGILSDSIDSDCYGRRIEVYNLGYPSLSVTKDLLIIDKIMKYDPDLVLWFITLEALNQNNQLTTPLVKNNPVEVNRLIKTYGLKWSPFDVPLWDRSLVARRRDYADLLRLQLYGIMWAATGVDQVYPESYTPAQRDFSFDSTYKEYFSENIQPEDLALDVLKQGINTAGSTEFIVINEPILISSGENSQVRYNFYYPRWAYNQYREILGGFTAKNGIQYVDFWDLIPEENFTNSAIHLDAAGERMLAEKIQLIIEDHCEQNFN